MCFRFEQLAAAAAGASLRRRECDLGAAGQIDGDDQVAAVIGCEFCIQRATQPVTPARDETFNPQLHSRRAVTWPQYQAKVGAVGARRRH